MSLKDHLFLRLGLFKKVHLPIPVISVGNLTFGGTGKTPVIEFLVNYFLKKGKKPGIVCRAYKAQAKRPEKVNLSSVGQMAHHYGDEASLLAQKLGGVPIYAGEKKYECALAMLEKEDVDLILIDDGFQHHFLHRDVDIVLLDATKSSAEYLFPPFGRARESMKALFRAHAVILTKTNMAKVGDLIQLKKQIPAKLPCFDFSFKISEMRSFFDPNSVLPLNIAQKGVVFCGLGNGESFFSSVSDMIPAAKLDRLSFPDHHQFTAADIERICSHGADFYITSEKDAVKLMNLWPSDQKLWVTKLELQPKESIESWHGFFAGFGL